MTVNDDWGPFIEHALANDAVRRGWDRWLEVVGSRYHIGYELVGGTLASHMDASLRSSRNVSELVAEDLGRGFVPSDVLDVGSSAGLKCFALRRQYPSARVWGIEPDREAYEVADAMVRATGDERLRFVHGYGEHLPFDDSSFDLITCHTVIEHVADVPACIGEMARVLKPGGALHLDAPNYMWPYEPHLGVVVPPLCPKPLMRLMARVQGAGEMAAFVEHLQLVHPHWIEGLFRRSGLVWENRMQRKIDAIGEGDAVQIHRAGLARLLRILWKAGIGRWAARQLVALRIYPSLQYTARRPA
jgi:SAM-dependent methyltransferase